MEALPRSELHSAGMLAVGSRCGHIAVFDAASMQQQELIVLSADTASLQNRPAEPCSSSADPAQGGKQELLYILYILGLLMIILFLLV